MASRRKSADTNYAIHGEFVLVMNTSGELLWRGNNPQATGVAFAADGRPMFIAADPAFRKKIYRLDELGQKHAFETAALEYITAYPRQFLVNVLNKIKIFWWFSPLTGLIYTPSLLTIYRAYYIVVAALAIVGAGIMLRSGWRIDLLALFLGLFAVMTLGQSLFYVQAKHRWALEPLLLILTSAALCTLLRRLAPSSCANSHQV